MYYIVAVYEISHTTVDDATRTNNVMLVPKPVILHVRLDQISVNLTSEGVTFNYIIATYKQAHIHAET